MKTLITGGVGFIGSYVSEALMQQGHDICIYDNFNDYYNPDYKRGNIKQMQQTAKDCGKDLVIIEGDIRDKNTLDACFSKYSFDAVIHLAACAGVRPSIENAPLYMDVNINGTVQILECMKNYGVKKLLFASSSSVYGNNENAPFSENENVDSPISPYAATKKAGELICHTYHHLYNMSVACLRFFTVYGPRQRPDLAIYKFTEKICNGAELPFYGDGSMGRDYTYIDDTVSGILLALDWVCAEDGRFEVFNLGESYTVSLTKMVETLEKSLGISAKINRLPVPPGDVKLTWADISKARTLLGYNPSTSFEDGISKFVEWFNTNRRNK